MRMESPETIIKEDLSCSAETNPCRERIEDVTNINGDVAPSPAVCNTDSFSDEKDCISFNIDGIKKENEKNEEDIGDGSKNEVAVEDHPSGEESSINEIGTFENLEGHFVKVEVLEGDDDNAEDSSCEEVEIIGVDKKSFKPSIFVRRESDLKANQIECENNDVFIVEADPVFDQIHSSTESSGVKREVVDSDEESIISLHSDECYDEDVKSSREAILKCNLKRKSEPSEILKVKKQKASVSVSKIVSANKQKQGQTSALSPPVPALGKLRNIIGSNFKKLKLNLNESYDARSELGLCYKHEEAPLDSASNNLSSDGSTYECPKCKANFKWKTTLKFHMFNHLEDKALECNVCFKLFLSPAYLNEHKKVHLNEAHERNFNCQDCSGQFETEASLSVHKLSHAKLEQKHYVCNVCKEQFKSLFSLNSHKAKHSSAIKYECKPCDLRFKTLKTLTRHIATHSVESKVKEKV